MLTVDTRLQKCVTDLRRPGLPGQPTQRLCITDVIGLLQQRPTDQLRLNGHKADQHLKDWTHEVHIKIKKVVCLLESLGVRC